METLELGVDARGVARIVMNRPEVFNAFNEQMIGELTACMQGCVADPAVRAIVLAGSGKAFSAGADIQWMKRAAQESLEWNAQEARRFADMLALIAACPKPTLARVHGVALGGGLGLICACDIAIAPDDARFAVSEARLGVLPSVIAPYLINAIGLREARRLALTANRIPASEAQRLGLVHEVVPLVELDAAVERWLAELLAGGPRAQAEIKTLFGQLQVGEITPAVRELTAQTIARVRLSDEAREGFTAFLAKRPPTWIFGNDGIEDEDV
ncbi:enoyl-CoA hydratase-related protein [Paucibacter sp. R3-3]|uniref:Enoyl-CoA hydratase-related protein n=1 Tax=Roseateles agri TaxID=3098619 RepID=A0ABU5DQG8_9BURK|nr:enoyl-CoA hydratase-related protein [Paucibacter sp. R3-3]MDY0748565.1 enoyl-CoA hydratase-related protein [Paucibacter sp. R3-3]